MFLNIHSHFIQNQGIEIINAFPDENTENLFSIGIHPCFINSLHIDNQLETIKQKLQHKNCIALGEIGLDKLCAVDFSLQQKVLEKQMKLATEYQKPIIIHCVKAHQEIISIFKKSDFACAKIIHGFNKNQHIAMQFLANNFYLSFGKSLLYSATLQKVFHNIPLEKIFLETDETNLSIRTIYQKAAILKNLSIEQLQQIILENAKNANFHFQDYALR